MTAHVTVMLTDNQRAHLNHLTRSGTIKARVLTKARILLLTDRSQGCQRTDAEIASALTISRPTIVRTRARFVADGLDAALYDKHRPGGTPKLAGTEQATLTLLACSTPPDGRSRWTLRLLAKQMVELGHVESVSHVTIGEHLKKMTSSPGVSNATASASQEPSS